ncbi:GH25 family lysozyme [Rothia terrae]|uniref:Peptidoglycan DD-metalloendopeptidase family protein n=1 Tax=Rothia terrae TaxID=396015 RepID=A0A7H2BGB0_9MICC|nr:GH25 family lysozyme [Rothia terrae]QNV38706.1 peptidoglycan DD-metalloendopeptidase family protein [Rothia terrae]
MPYTGIDISNYQAGLPQPVIAQADVVIIKATEGNTFRDPHTADLFMKALREGKKIGVYHFARPGTTAAAQAQYMLDYMTELQLTPDFYVLDFEDETQTHDEAWAKAFLDYTAEVSGLPVWFYCYVAPLKAYKYKSIRPHYKFWLAGYYLGYNPIFGFTPPMSLDEYILFNDVNTVGIDFAGWQYTPVGRLPGWDADLDLNFFFDDAFNEMVGAITPAPVALAQLEYPVDVNTRISQDFAQSGTNFNLATGGHTGRDYAVNIDTPVEVVAPGTVLWADWASNLPGDDSTAGWESRWLVHKSFAGVTVVVDHGSYLSLYAHLNFTPMNVGDAVEKGDVIGYSGNTGSATTGPHLHWEIVPKPFAWWTNGYYGRVSPGAFVEASNKEIERVAKAAGISIEKDFLEEIMALYNSKEEFEAALRKNIAQPILDELTPGKAGVKNAGNVFIMLYNIAGHLEEFKNLFMPGKAGVRYEGGMRSLVRSIVEGKK